MNYNKKTLENLFIIINENLFDGLLCKPYFEIMHYRKEYGWCEHYKGNQFVYISDNMCYYDLFNTLVHELIHVWQAQNSKLMNHKKEFIAWAEKAYSVFYE